MNKKILLRGNGDFTDEQFEQVLKANDERHMMLSLGLTTSPGCNMRCVFCYSDSGTREAGNEIWELMDLKDFEKAIKESAKLGAQSVILVGIGETLMDKKIRQIIEMISTNGMYPLVFTNGTLLDRDMVKFLRRNQTTIYLSLNAVKEEIFEKISGSKGLFHKVMEGIDNCLDEGFGQITEHNGHQVTDFAVNTMVMKENLDHIDEIKDFCNRKNILFTCRLPEKLGTAKDSWDSLIAGSLEEEEKMKNIAMKHSLGGEVFRTDFGCLFWIAGVLLGVDGKARLCYSLNNKKDFGNIKTDSMLEIMDYFCPIHAEMV
ncbi:MAG: radical SAM protein [Candidatus Bathyarchaeota archaeon]